MERLSVLGLPVDIVDMKAALETVDGIIRSRSASPAYVVAANPEKVFALRARKELATWFAQAALIVPDGIGLVMAVRFLYGKRLCRVAGADLMEAICGLAAGKGYRVFLFGSSEPVNRLASATLQRRYPGLVVCGRANGYVRPEEMSALIKSINEAQPDVLFVGLGSPRQEEWLRANLPKLRVGVCQGIGGTLDVVSGAARRAPRPLRDCGLEWLYRLVSQPSRAGRQLVLLRFAAEVLAARFRRGPLGMPSLSRPP